MTVFLLGLAAAIGLLWALRDWEADRPARHRRRDCAYRQCPHPPLSHVRRIPSDRGDR